MTAIPVDFYLALSAVLFAIGGYGVLSRRNAVGVLMGIELMLNAANINFLAFWRHVAPKALEGQVFVLVVITVAAAEAAVALAIVLNIYRNFGAINVDDVDLMKG